MSLHLSRIDILNFCYSSKEGKYYSPIKKKKKRSEKKVGQFFFSLFFFFWEKRNALSTMETMPVRLL